MSGGVPKSWEIRDRSHNTSFAAEVAAMYSLSVVDRECKGYCGWARHGAGCGAERGTSRGSEEKRVRIHLQARSNIQSDTYQVQNIKGNKEKPKRGKRA